MSIKEKINAICFAIDLARINHIDAEIRLIYRTRKKRNQLASKIEYVESENQWKKECKKGIAQWRGQGNDSGVAHLLLTPVFDQRAWKQEQIQLHPWIQYCSARPFSWRG